MYGQFFEQASFSPGFLYDYKNEACTLTSEQLKPEDKGQAKAKPRAEGCNLMIVMFLDQQPLYRVTNAERIIELVHESQIFK